MKDKMDEIDTILVHYSGGLDSQLCVSNLAKLGYDLYLVTYDTGALIKPEICVNNVNILKERYPEKIEHEIIPIYGLFKKIALKDITSDIKYYGDNLVCMGCKLSMLAHSIIECKKKGITKIADGSNKRQGDWPEQKPCSLSAMEKICEKYGIEYIHPIYNSGDKSSIKEKLEFDGLLPKGIEAACIFGDTFGDVADDIVEAYINDKTPLIENFIQQELDELDL